MKTLPPDLLERYLKNPVAMDSEVRKALNLRTDRYYTVSVYPVAGVVREERTRVVTAKKISKSG